MVTRRRVVAAKTGDGRIVLVEEDLSSLRPGTILVRVHNSLVSPGTELSGWRGFRAQAEAPQNYPKLQPFGYSNAGVVLEVGEGVHRFAPGDRVACIGHGFALHTDYAVVPHHLCVRLPESVLMLMGRSP